MDNPNETQISNYMDLTDINIDTQLNESSKIKLDRPPRNFGKIGDLRSVQEIPKKYQCVFEFPLFNMIQSHVIDDVLYSDAPLVISAPTGSGKTAVFELAIIRLLMNFEELNMKDDYKIVYVAPVKALCGERLTDWHTKFRKIGLSCIVVTGDSDIIDCQQLKDKHIILTTPEKWDAMTRYSNDKLNLIANVKLFLIDEVHLLNEETRGPILEALVSRMKILQKSKQIRFMAISATIPNIEDIAEWLGAEKDPAIYFKIGEEFRPVKLKKIVVGYFCAPNCTAFKFDLSLNYKLQSIIMQHAEGKPTLIFCNTRKSVEMTSKHISQEIKFHLTPDQQNTLKDAARSLVDNKMRTQLLNGVGNHHAGMTPENRNTIECLFRNGSLPVLVTTSTLAMGVNLPAHLVIVKSTQHYVNGGYQDYSETNLLQMIGRAGRPQFDTSATVVIMTKNNEKIRYEKMLGGTELIESNLHRHLTEHINAEVVLNIITDIAVALDWLRSTFLYVRVLKNPKHYNIPANFTKDKIEKKLQDLCQIEINALNRYGMLQIDNHDGFSLYPTNMGRMMANYYLAFETVKVFLEVKGTETLSEMLMIISKCQEFSETRLRVNDKKTLNTLNRCKFQLTIRFPIPGNIKTAPMKVNCLIQAIFGCLRIQDPSLIQESAKIMRNGEKISKCLVEYLLKKEKCFQSLLHSLLLNKCFHAKLWENSTFVVKQLQKIGPVLATMLVSSGKTTFKSILETNPRDIERIINRAPPMGNEIQNAVTHLPFYRLDVFPPEEQILKVKISVKLLNPDNINSQCTVGHYKCMTLLVGDTENNILLCEKLIHKNMAAMIEHTQYIDVIATDNHVIHAHLISENWVGIDCNEKVEIIINKDLIQTNSTNLNENNGSKTVTKPKRKITKSKDNEQQQNTMLSYLVPTPKVPKPANKSAITLRTITANSTIQKNAAIQNINHVTVTNRDKNKEPVTLNPGSSKLQNINHFTVTNSDKNKEPLTLNPGSSKIQLNKLEVSEQKKSQNLPLNIFNSKLNKYNQNAKIINRQSVENIGQNHNLETLKNINNSNISKTQIETIISQNTPSMPVTQDYTQNSQAEHTKTELSLGKNESFPKTFQEYIKQKSAELKKDTLVNDMFDFDIGLEEYIMSTFEDPEFDSDPALSSATEILNTEQKPIKKHFENPILVAYTSDSDTEPDLTYIDKLKEENNKQNKSISIKSVRNENTIAANVINNKKQQMESFNTSSETQPKNSIHTDNIADYYKRYKNLNLEQYFKQSSPEEQKLVTISDCESETDYPLSYPDKPEQRINKEKSNTIKSILDEYVSVSQSINLGRNTSRQVIDKNKQRVRKILSYNNPSFISHETQPNNSNHNDTITNYYKKNKNLNLFSFNKKSNNTKILPQDYNSCVSSANSYVIKPVENQPKFINKHRKVDFIQRKIPKPNSGMLQQKYNASLSDVAPNIKIPAKKSRLSFEPVTKEHLEYPGTDYEQFSLKNKDIYNSDTYNNPNLTSKWDNYTSSNSNSVHRNNYPVTSTSTGNLASSEASIVLSANNNTNKNFNNYLIEDDYPDLTPVASTSTNLTSKTIGTYTNEPLETRENINVTKYCYLLKDQKQDNVKMSMTIYEKKENNLRNENHENVLEYDLEYNYKANAANQNWNNSMYPDEELVNSSNEGISSVIESNNEDEHHHFTFYPRVSPELNYKPYFRKGSL